MIKPKTDEEKLADSMARARIRDSLSVRWDAINAVYDMWKKYKDYTIIQERFGLTKYMVDKLVRLAMLPDRLKEAINQGEIYSNSKTAENAALRAVDALNWRKGGDVSADDVLELAIEYTKGEIEPAILTAEARKGGSVKGIVGRANKTRKNFTITFSKEIDEKLSREEKNRLITEIEKRKSTQEDVELDPDQPKNTKGKNWLN